MLRLVVDEVAVARKYQSECTELRQHTRMVSLPKNTRAAAWLLPFTRSVPLSALQWTAHQRMQNSELAQRLLLITLTYAASAQCLQRANVAAMNQSSCHRPHMGP